MEYDIPFETDHCGTCTRCLDACPTQAFDGPFELDPRRCISYLTIEHRSSIPEDLRRKIGDWIFGCDVCQDVCPWNSKSPPSGDPTFEPRLDSNPVELRPLLEITEEEFKTRFRGTALYRTGRSQTVRNAAIVAGNQRCMDLRPTLRGLLDDPNPHVREAAEWALSQIQLDEGHCPPDCGSTIMPTQTLQTLEDGNEWHVEQEDRAAD